MNESHTWEFTCKACYGHQLTVSRNWTILAGPNTERWQEWGPLDANHHWHFEFKEKMKDEEEDDDEVDIEGEEDDEDEDDVERGDFGAYERDDSASNPEEYEIFEPQDDLESIEFYVNCASCDREIEFGWSKPNRGGSIFPVECSDFTPGKIWPEPRYLEAWRQKGWLKMENDRP